jgi:hypothetical protein
MKIELCIRTIMGVFALCCILFKVIMQCIRRIDTEFAKEGSIYTYLDHLEEEEACNCILVVKTCHKKWCQT